MDKAVIYIHGSGGNAEEAEHYKPLFADCEVFGLEYNAETPWEAKEEFPRLLCSICEGYKSVTLIANSIGAYFAMASLYDWHFERAYFISPVVDMQRLIEDMMRADGISEAVLCEKSVIESSFGQTLSWEYLMYVRNNKIRWTVPTHILYGSLDFLTSYETVSSFAESTGSTLTVMDGGEHWFHTEEQMDFLDSWIREHR